MVGFPLLLIPLAIYNIVVWLMPSVSLTEPHPNWPWHPSDERSCTVDAKMNSPTMTTA